MKRYFNIPTKILMLFAVLFTATACNTDDDIDAIFREQTWYLTYVQDGNVKRHPEHNKFYSIDFKNDNFTATMPNGAVIKGKWSADGDKSRSFNSYNVVTEGSIKGDTIAERMYEIIKNAKNYGGDTNWLQIKQDKNRYMQFYN
jgi:hypothetical protein